MTENAAGEIAYVLYDDAADKRVAEIDEEGRRTAFAYVAALWPKAIEPGAGISVVLRSRPDRYSRRRAQKISG